MKMRTDFEQKLIDLILQDKYADTKMEQIKRAFIDEGWIIPNQALTNLLAQSKQELMRLKLTPTPTYRIAEEQDASGGYQMTEVMTGPEWHTRFNREYSRGLREEEAMSLGDIARHAAGRACGCIQENE